MRPAEVERLSATEALQTPPLLPPRRRLPPSPSPSPPPEHLEVPAARVLSPTPTEAPGPAGLRPVIVVAPVPTRPGAVDAPPIVEPAPEMVPTIAPAATRTGWMPGVEALRGVAATAVVVFHMWALTTLPRFPGSNFIVGLGVWAVDLFFLLSGFLLVQSFWEQPRTTSLGQYYVRRIFRIVPAYYVSVAVLFLFFAQREIVFSHVGRTQVIANLTFTQWMSPTTSSSLNVSGVFWTLSIEACLYALLPLFAWLIARKPILTGGLLFAAGMAYRVYVAVDGKALEDFLFKAVPDHPAGSGHLYMLRQFPGIVPLFVIGMLLRWWLHYRPGARPVTPAGGRSAAVLAALLIPSLLVLYPGQDAVDYTNRALFVAFDVAICLLLVPALAYAGRTVAGALSVPMRALVWLGKRSYGIYLWHFPVILIALDRGPFLRPPALDHVWVRLGLATVASLVLGALSYWLVEKPTRKVGRRVAAALG